MGSKTKIIVDTNHSPLAKPENPHIQFYKLLMANKALERGWAQTIIDDNITGSTASLRDFIKLSKKYDMLGNIKIMSNDIDYSIIMNELIKLDTVEEIDSIHLDKYDMKSKEITELLIDANGYIYNDGPIQIGSETYEPLAYAQVNRLIEEEEDKEKDFYIIDYAPENYGEYTGLIKIEYVDAESGTTQYYQTDIPYSSSDVYEGIEVLYRYDDYHFRKQYIFNEDIIEDAKNTSSREITDISGSPIIPIYIQHGEIIPSEDEDSDLYKEIKEIFKTLNIEYPDIADKLINIESTEPPEDGSVEDRKARTDFNESIYLQSKYEDYEAYKEKQQEDYDNALESNTMDNVQDIMFVMQPKLENMDYASRIVSFDSLNAIFSRIELSDKTQNIEIKREESKENSYSFSQEHEYYKYLFDVIDFSIKIYEVEESITWENEPMWEMNLNAYLNKGHLVKSKKTFLMYGGNKDEGLHSFDCENILHVPDYKDRELVETIKDIDSEYTEEMKEGFIRICKQISSSPTGKQRYKEIILYAPIAISSVYIEGANSYTESEAMAYMIFDDTGNEQYLRKMFIPILSDVIEDIPFFYVTAAKSGLMSIHTHYGIMEEIPWYKSWIFKFLIMLVIVIISTIITGGNVTVAVTNFISNTLKSVAISQLSKALGLEEIGVFVQLVYTLSFNYASMSQLDISNIILKSLGELKMISLRKEFENLEEERKNFNITIQTYQEKLEDEIEKAGGNQVDLSDYYLWLIQMSGKDISQYMTNFSGSISRPSSLPPSVGLPR